MGYTHPTLVQVRLLAGAVYGVGAVHPARFSRKGYLGEGAHRFRKDGGVRHSHDPEDPHASREFAGREGGGAGALEGAVHADLQLL